MVDRTVTDAGFFHAADELFKSVHVLKRVAVQFHIGDVSAIGESMIRCLQTYFIKGIDVKVDWNVEGVGVVVAVGDARNHTKTLAVDLDKSSGRPSAGVAMSEKLSFLFSLSASILARIWPMISNPRFCAYSLCPWC